MNQDRFGYEWEKYNEIKPEYREQYREQFLNWIHPLTPDFFEGKRVLDAGCGMGRNSYWALQWGAASLVGCDHDSRSVAAATQTLAEFPNATVELQDLEHLPWENEFDFIFSIGVIHHTVHPDKAVEQLKKALKPGGELLFWVYSSVGFEEILKILDPVRKYITSKMNLTLLHLLTYFISVPLYVLLRLVPPQREYFKQLKTFSLSHLHSILFDQLLPPIARYYSRAEAVALLAGFKNVVVYAPLNNNGWIVRGTK